MATNQAKKGFDAKVWWGDLAPKRRQQYALGGVIVGVVLLSWLMLAGSGGTTRTRDVGKDDAKVTNSLLPDENTRDIGMTGLAKDVEGQREESQSMAERLGRLEEIQQERDRMQTEGGGVRGRDQQMRQELEELRTQLAEMQKNGVPAAQGPLGQGQAPIGPPPEDNGGQDAATGYGGIRSIGQKEATQAQPGYGGAMADANAGTGGESATTPKAVPTMYLPSGSIITGIMLTGLDAPTGKGAMKDPVPVLVRIQKEAILPNMYRADIKECFALVAGQGDLASERAYLRSETISCVRRDKTVIDMSMKAYVVDTDGKAGLRGRLVSKQGSAVSKAILASFAEGVAKAFSGQNSNNVSNGQVDYGSAAESGMVGGFSSSLDRISKYYLDLADQLFPILEIDAGRKVTLVLVKGLEMNSVREPE